MQKFMMLMLLCSIPLIAADKKSAPSREHNKTAEAIKKAMEKEKKYAKEQRFYTGKEYDLKEKEVDPDALKNVHVIEPEYDFDMDTGVYDD